VRIFFTHQRAEWREITDEIAYNGASVLCFCSRDAERDVGRGEGITGDYDDC
jgi:hypothetical protein